MNATQKRFFWITAAILTTLLSIGMGGLLLSCNKSQKGQSGTTAPHVDTVRQRLERKVTTAKDTAKAAHQRTYQTQKPYENAVTEYLFVRDSLFGLRPAAPDTAR
ncbi:hypothetical protein [Fibrella aquatica]|uniref:hypothetical protein n=1 Tax=Fibrella aquatica TaxID=3242487 RepID=UPI00352280E6